MSHTHQLFPDDLSPVLKLSYMLAYWVKSVVAQYFSYAKHLKNRLAKIMHIL
jgi:hypothetical protein